MFFDLIPFLFLGCLSYFGLTYVVDKKIRKLFKTYRKQDTSFTFEKDVKQSVAQDIQEHTFSHEVEEGNTQIDLEH